MCAAIDIGSSDCADVDRGNWYPVRGYRQPITRWGIYTEGKGLAPESLERTLSALQTQTNKSNIGGSLNHLKQLSKLL